MVGRLLKPLALVALALALAPVSSVGASTTPTPTTGACVVSGTATFSPGVNIVPQTVSIAVNVGGTCYGSPLGDTVGVNIAASPLQSCEIGFGPTSDVVQFADNPPGLNSGTGDLVVFPGGGEATITAGIVVGTLTYAWTGDVTACTNPTGVRSTGVTGVFTYVSE
jgi:hypothetical protein